MKRLFKIMLVCMLNVGIVGCGSKQESLDEGLKDYPDSITTINKIVNDYVNNGITLEYSGFVTGSEIGGIYKNGDCEIKIIVDKSGNFINLELKDYGIKDEKYSDSYTSSLEKSVQLDTFDMSIDNCNSIIDFFNDKKEEEKNINGYIVEQTYDTFIIKQKTNEALSKAIPITIDQIEFVGKRIYTDSIGTIYMETKFKNNSNKIIKNIDFEYNVDGETQYLMCSDTLKPGKTSTKTDTFGPKSKKFKDMKLLSVEITYRQDNGEDGYIEYDAELKEYKWY